MTNKIILANAFSLQMITSIIEDTPLVQFRAMELDEVKDVVEFAGTRGILTNAIGHADTAHIVGNMIGATLVPNRINVALDENTTIIVAQVIGGRLPEGCTTLPEGTKIKFIEVSLMTE